MTSLSYPRLIRILAAASGFLVIALGAFGAHALRSRLNDHAMDVFQTAIRYQMFQTLALLFLSSHVEKQPARLQIVSVWMLLYGTLIFSGSLYLLALSGVNAWGAVTPIGGILLLLGWGGMFSYFCQTRN